MEKSKRKIITHNRRTMSSMMILNHKLPSKQNTAANMMTYLRSLDPNSWETFETEASRQT